MQNPVAVPVLIKTNTAAQLQVNSNVKVLPADGYWSGTLDVNFSADEDLLVGSGSGEYDHHQVDFNAHYILSTFVEAGWEETGYLFLVMQVGVPQVSFNYHNSGAYAVNDLCYVGLREDGGSLTGSVDLDTYNNNLFVTFLINVDEPSGSPYSTVEFLIPTYLQVKGTQFTEDLCTGQRKEVESGPARLTEFGDFTQTRGWLSDGRVFNGEPWQFTI